MKIGKDLIAEEVRKVESLFTKKGNKRPIKIKKELQQLMREDVGIVRDERRLAHALSEIARMRDDLENNALISEIRRYNTDVLDTIELRNMLTCGELIAHSARSRTESRGAHLRLDYPNKDDAQWSKNIIIWKKNNQFKTLLSDVNTTAV
jgi:succinate dehydrogenase/fumarate reductase flavoprotein subunit